MTLQRSMAPRVLTAELANAGAEDGALAVAATVHRLAGLAAMFEGDERLSRQLKRALV